MNWPDAIDDRLLADVSALGKADVGGLRVKGSDEITFIDLLNQTSCLTNLQCGFSMPVGVGVGADGGGGGGGGDGKGRINLLLGMAPRARCCKRHRENNAYEA